MVVGILIIRIVYQRRLQAKLQEEVRNLLFEYVPMGDDNEIETVNFADNFDFSAPPTQVESKHPPVYIPPKRSDKNPILSSSAERIAAASEKGNAALPQDTLLGDEETV